MAPAAWFKTLAAHLENDFDMRPLISEPCIFSKTKKIDGKDETIWCACFVDDVLYTSTSPVLEREFYKTLSSRFKNQRIRIWTSIMDSRNGRRL